jgi:ligand-binding sensor domain-containing protein/signal transduction histidine kinase
LRRNGAEKWPSPTTGTIKRLYLITASLEKSPVPRFHWTVAVTALLLGGFAIVAPRVRAASEISSPPIIKHWGTKEGLPHSAVIAVIQTRDRYLWVGTMNGLVRFDGIRFTEFEGPVAPKLNTSTIVHLYEDSQTNLWVGTDSAGTALIRSDGSIQSPLQNTDVHGKLMSACEDDAGAVWLYTSSGKLIRFRNGQSDSWQVGIEFSNCRGLIAEDPKRFWVGDDSGLYGFDPSASEKSSSLFLKNNVGVTNLNFLLASRSGGFWCLADGRVRKWKSDRLEKDLGPYLWPPNARVSAACEDREGNLVVGTLNVNDGVYWYASDGKAAHVSSAQGLSHDGILSLCVDHEGSLWVGTDGGGLNRVKRSGFAVLEESRGKTMSSVCEDGEGALWIAWGGTAMRWKGSELQRFIPTLEGVNLDVSVVFADRSNRLWAGTRNGGLFQWRADRFEPVTIGGGILPGILAIHQDRKGILWFGTLGGLARWDEREWKTFTSREELPANVVRAIADDADGNLWIGTDGGGLNRLREGQILSASNEPLWEKISSLWVDADNILWIGTEGGGLVRRQGDKLKTFTKREGLVSNKLGYIVEDKQGFLWIGSSAGLMRVRKQELNDLANGGTNSILCRAYDEADGLPTGECSSGAQPGAFCARDGTLWFTTTKGLVLLDPTRLKLNTNQPPVLIESVWVAQREQNTNGLRASPLQGVTISPGKEGLEIHYTSLNLAAPERARFRYRLEGHELSWTEAGDSRVARFPKLPPDNYRFQVAACNEDGLWNKDGGSIAVVVLPPFWMTWWFRGAAVLCALGMVIGAVYYVSTQNLQRQLEMFRRQEAVEKERSRIARDLHDQLGANLTQVALLGELAESDKDLPDEVEAHAQQISQTARETTRALDEIVWEANPSNDTLDSLITYSCKYAQEYLALARLRYRLDVPESLPTVPIPPDVRHNVFLAFKEAVNNVVKHAQASSAQVRLRLEPNRFILEIQDDGCGLAGGQDKAARNGLRNMRKRMEDISGDFSVGPAPGGGTRVRLTAPLGKR